MLKYPLYLLLAVALCFGAVACKSKQTQAQLNAEKEKGWREQQRQRAVKYYSELAEKYPDSPFAAQAKQKLQQLGLPTPGAKAAAGKATVKK